MRILPQNFLLHRRIDLAKGGIRIATLSGIGIVCGSCAKFPSNANANFTAITVSFTVSGSINPAYIYDVAFTTSSAVNPPVLYAPLPVINSSNPNGRMAGSPTEFVEFPSPAGYVSSQPFALYQFATSKQVPNPNDPTNPINLGVYSQSTLGQITNFTTPWSGGVDQSTLTFTVYTNLLPDANGDLGKALQSMQVNILTMNRVANLGSGTRVIDALGNSSTVSGLTNFLQINLLQSGTTDNSNGLEPQGDTFGGLDPDVDIKNFSVTISQP